MTAYSLHVRADALNWDVKVEITMRLITLITFINAAHDSFLNQKSKKSAQFIFLLL